MTEDVFAAWQADRAAGPGRDHARPDPRPGRELNQQARAHRLDGADPASVGPARRLADGNEASVGELIITRTNDRRLRTSATDWVKNGDRWTVLGLHEGGDLTVQHTQHGRTVRLPPDYVEASTELGYACTVHTAQGVTADTMHGLATGNESRQQLYTMLTRGQTRQPRLPRGRRRRRPALGDPPDPGPAAHPHRHPRADAGPRRRPAVRDQPASASRPTPPPGSARPPSATSTASTSPPRHVVGPDVVEALDSTVDQLLPGLSDEAAWPTLRAHLLLLGAAGENPVEALRDGRERPRTGLAPSDRAAVLDWRLDASGLRNAGTGPLPWMPGVPARLADDPHWGAYLDQRAHLVDQLADEVHGRGRGTDVAADLGAERDPTRHRHGGRRRGLASGHAGPRRRPSTDRRTAAAEGLLHLAATAQPAHHRRPHPGAQGMAPAALLAGPAGPRRRVHPAPGRTARGHVARRRSPPTSCSAPPADRPALCPTSTPRPRCGGAWHATSRPPWPPRSGTALTARGSPPAGQRSWPTCSAPSGPPASRPAPGGPRWSPTSTTDCSAAGSSRPCCRPGSALHLPTTSTSARRWCGEPRSRSNRSPTSTSTTTTSTSRRRTCGTASSPTRPRSSTTPTTSNGRSRTTPRPTATTWSTSPSRTGSTMRPGRRRPSAAEPTSTRTSTSRATCSLAALHPRPRRHSARAHRRRPPARLPARRGVALLPRHPRAHARDQRDHAGVLRVPVHRLVGSRLPHRPVRRSTSPGTSTSVPDRRRPGGPTWSTTCATAASATPRCSPPGSPPPPAPAD